MDVFVESYAEPPEEIWLDLDATDDPLHGRQEGRFFHGYYGRYCYLPLYVFCGAHLLCARLRRSNIDASAGAEEELARIVVRGDSGFCRELLMRWCEENGVDYVFGMALNPRLVRAIRRDLYRTEAAYRRSGKPARRYRDFRYRTRTGPGPGGWWARRSTCPKGRTRGSWSPGYRSFGKTCRTVPDGSAVHASSFFLFPRSISSFFGGSRTDGTDASR